MDESILRKLSSVELHEDERTCLRIDEPDIQEGLHEDALSILAHLHGGKPFNLTVFKTAMGRAWRCGSFSIQRFDDQFFQVFFGTQETVEFVLSQGPWNFENHLVLVRPRCHDAFHPSHCLEKESFWLLLIGLPRFCYTWEVGSKLPALFDSVTTIQLREDRSLGTKFFRIRALIPLHKPLKRIFRITTPDGTTHVDLLKYERLPMFCFCCGFIGHRFRECPSLPKEPVQIDTLAYGPWMGGVDYIHSDQLFSKEIVPCPADIEGILDGLSPVAESSGVTGTSLTLPVAVPAVAPSGIPVGCEIVPQTFHGSLTPQKRRHPITRSASSVGSPDLGLKKPKVIPAKVARQPRRSP